MQIIEFVIAFGVMLALHESGHFLFSKLFGIEVEEFGLGLPPRICKLFTWKGTDFSLNWIPFGAFVRPKGEFEDGSVSGEDSLRSAAPWKQILILFGGPLMNFATAFVLFSLCVQQLGFTDPTKVFIDEVQPGSPAENAGMKAGDRFLSFAGEDVDYFDRITELTNAHLGEEVPVTLLRNGEMVDVRITPQANPPEGQGAMGVLIAAGIQEADGLDCIRGGFLQTISVTKQYLQGLWQMISGSMEVGLESFVGPVGMFSLYQDVAQQDEEDALAVEQHVEELAESGADVSQKTTATVSGAWVNRFSFFALISVCLGVTNLFPIPGLDGGRILFLLPEMLFKKKVPLRVETTFNGIFMTLLMILMFAIMAKDIWMIGQ